MSQVCYLTKDKTGRTLEVVSGWDKPLQQYFMTLFDTDRDDQPVWTALSNPSPEDAVGVDRFKRMLVLRQLDVPQDYWEVVQRQEGNLRYTWDQEHNTWVCTKL